jgi:hypothetical protein
MTLTEGNGPSLEREATMELARNILPEPEVLPAGVHSDNYLFDALGERYGLVLEQVKDVAKKYRVATRMALSIFADRVTDEEFKKLHCTQTGGQDRDEIYNDLDPRERAVVSLLVDYFESPEEKREPLMLGDDFEKLVKIKAIFGDQFSVFGDEIAVVFGNDVDPKIWESFDEKIKVPFIMEQPPMPWFFLEEDRELVEAIRASSGDAPDPTEIVLVWDVDEYLRIGRETELGTDQGGNSSINRDEMEQDLDSPHSKK